MNARLALVCMPLFVVSLIVVWAAHRARGDKPAHRRFLAAGFMILLWQLSGMWELLAPNARALRYAHNLAIPIAAFVALSFLMLTLDFYGLSQYVSRQVLFLMAVLPSVTLLLALTGDPWLLLTREISVQSGHPAYAVYIVQGTWYWAHVGYCVLLYGMGIYHAMNQHLRLPRSFRECSSLMLAAQCVVAGTAVISFVSARGTALVMIGVGCCCALVALYVAMINNGRMNYLFMARTHILDQLDTSIFILDRDRNILEANEAARNSLWIWTGQDQTDSLEGVLEMLRNMGAKFEDAVEGETGIDVTISTRAISRVYNVREEFLHDKGGRILGSFVACTDVTRNRRLIHWLEQTSGTDVLTGLANRSSLALRRAEYESGEVLPLSVIAGDVDGLKAVNDTLGHHYGDQLLVAIGRALGDSTPPGGTTYRTGGDEFVMLLPRTGPEEAERIKAEVLSRLKDVRIGPFGASIALGVATRTSHSLSLEEVMHEADQTMYRAKRDGRP